MCVSCHVTITGKADRAIIAPLDDMLAACLAARGGATGVGEESEESRGFLGVLPCRSVKTPSAVGASGRPARKSTRTS